MKKETQTHKTKRNLRGTTSHNVHDSNEHFRIEQLATIVFELTMSNWHIRHIGNESENFSQIRDWATPDVFGYGIHSISFRGTFLQTFRTVRTCHDSIILSLHSSFLLFSSLDIELFTCLINDHFSSTKQTFFSI